MKNTSRVVLGIERPKERAGNEGKLGKRGSRGFLGFELYFARPQDTRITSRFAYYHLRTVGYFGQAAM